MTPRPDRDLFDLEAVAREVARHDPDRGAGLARDAAEAFRERLGERQDDPALAAGWLRCLRRAGVAWEDAAPIVEALIVRFGADSRLRSAAAFLELDEARRAATAGNLDRAADLLAGPARALAEIDDRAYLAQALLGALRVFAAECARLRTSSPETVLPALDHLLDALVPVVDPWITALPPVPRRPTADRRVEERLSGRVRGSLLVRRLLRLAERWDDLCAAARGFREQGVASEWIADAEVEALVALGRLPEALDRVRTSRRSHPQAESLARREAEILHALGRDDEAMAVLEEAALASRSPWPWRDLASRWVDLGRTEDAITALRCGLAFHDPRQPGLVWKLHFKLAELLMDLGDEPGAAEEFWLAREARLAGGWGLGTDLIAFLGPRDALLEPHLRDLDSRRRTVRRNAVDRYRSSRDAFCSDRAVPAEIVALRQSFGFLRTEGASDQVFFDARLLPNRRLGTGNAVRAVVVASFDPRKGRPSRKAVWLGAAGPGDAASPARTSAKGSR